jgi:hypothetical protein
VKYLKWILIAVGVVLIVALGVYLFGAEGGIGGLVALIGALLFGRRRKPMSDADRDDLIEIADDGLEAAESRAEMERDNREREAVASTEADAIALEERANAAGSDDAPWRRRRD